MLKITKLADYSVIILSAMHGELQSANALAQATKLPEPTVSKILKLLAKSDIVRSIRGAQGGYALMRPLSDITIAQVIAAIDGPIALTACVEGANDNCSFAPLCSHKGRWNKVNNAIRETLDQMALSDMLQTNLKVEKVR